VSGQNGRNNIYRGKDGVGKKGRPRFPPARQEEECSHGKGREFGEKWGRSTRKERVKLAQFTGKGKRPRKGFQSGGIRKLDLVASEGKERSSGRKPRAGSTCGGASPGLQGGWAVCQHGALKLMNKEEGGSKFCGGTRAQRTKKHKKNHTTDRSQALANR